MSQPRDDETAYGYDQDREPPTSGFPEETGEAGQASQASQGSPYGERGGAEEQSGVPETETEMDASRRPPSEPQ